MSIYNTLRSMPTKVAEMLLAEGFMREMSPEDRERMDAQINALVEEWFGAASTVVVSSEKKEKKEKKSKTKPAVMSVVPAVMDKEYLETLTVSALKELGKDCAAMKGRKPRDKLIELLLEHLAVSSPVESVVDETETSGSEEEELRAEVLEPAPVAVKAADPSKKEKKPKEVKEKKPKEVKEKKPKEVKEKKKEEKKKDESESDDENTVELRAWYHPSELSKPLEERTKYFIDPKTNQLYHPDRLDEGNAEWTWNEETLEITPVG